MRWDLGAGAAENLGVRGDQERLADGGEPAMMAMAIGYPSTTRPLCVFVTMRARRSERGRGDVPRGIDRRRAPGERRPCPRGRAPHRARACQRLGTKFRIVKF